MSRRTRQRRARGPGGRRGRAGGGAPPRRRAGDAGDGHRRAEAVGAGDGGPDRHGGPRRRADAQEEGRGGAGEEGAVSWSASSPSATWWSGPWRRRSWASAPVKKFMSPKPETLKLADPVAYALNKMSVGRFRHVPLHRPWRRAGGDHLHPRHRRLHRRALPGGDPQPAVAARAGHAPSPRRRLRLEAGGPGAPGPVCLGGQDRPRSMPRSPRGTSCTSCPSRTGTGRCARPWASAAPPSRPWPWAPRRPRRRRRGPR